MDELSDLGRRVAAQLEELCGPSQALDQNSARCTSTLYAGDATRRQFRKSLINELISADDNVTRNGRLAMVTAGPPGSGKNYLVDEILDPAERYRHIDPDSVKERLLERALADGIYGDLLSTQLEDGGSVMPMELSGLVQNESTKIADTIRRICMRKGENVVVHGTLAWWELPTRYLHDLERGAYSQLEIVEVRVDLRVAQDQALTRWWSARRDPQAFPKGGRFVPARAIAQYYEADETSRCTRNAEAMFTQSQDSTLRAVDWTVHRRNPDGDLEATMRHSLRPDQLGRLVPSKHVLGHDAADNVTPLRRASREK